MVKEEAKGIVKSRIELNNEREPDDNFITDLIVLISDAYAAVKKVVETGKRIIGFVKNLFSKDD